MPDSKKTISEPESQSSWTEENILNFKLLCLGKCLPDQCIDIANSKYTVYNQRYKQMHINRVFCNVVTYPKAKKESFFHYGWSLHALIVHRVPLKHTLVCLMDF